MLIEFLDTCKKTPLPLDVTKIRLQRFLEVTFSDYFKDFIPKHALSTRTAQLYSSL